MSALAQVLDELRTKSADRITAWQTLEARPARFLPFPEWLPDRLRDALASRGIAELYSHQRLTADLVAAGRHVAVVTPTASGKTLCYNLPVLAGMLARPESRALYLFPTKALSQDQLAELHGLVGAAGADIKTHTYDGDTPASARRAIRNAGHIVVTNPDMLHTGILPHHTKWVRLFENLRYVVIDEMHQYRGVFGSHVANVLRRLKRVAAFYGSRPQFILSSATIANPGELAGSLTGEEVDVVAENGAPSGTKHFLLYNPPVVNAGLGIRRSYLLEARALAAAFLARNIPTIVFARSRLATEVLLSYMREVRPAEPGKRSRISGYRGGYLPHERREIERGLRTGEILGVVATNALELGVDIGQLDACVIAGYPGSIASSWQQAGRAGRRSGESIAVLVADSSPLNQFMVNHPEYFFGRSPEHALVNPQNPLIAVNHLKCAAFELPFAEGEGFGAAAAETAAHLDYLAEQRILHKSGNRWYWMADAFPAEAVSLRSAATDNFVIVDTSEPKARVIGELDRFAVPTLLHEDAIYLHGATQYHVDRLDWEEQKAHVKRVDVDYYTDAELAVKLTVLDELAAEPSVAGSCATAGLGEVEVRSMATIFKKIKFHTHENIGWGQIHLPEQEMHTSAWWLTFPQDQGGLRESDLQGGLVGFASIIHHVAALHLLSDVRDLHTAVQVKSPHTGRPTVFVYDSYPGGIGLAEKAFEIRRDILKAGLAMVSGCPCGAGCPSCVGPQAEVGAGGKAATVRLLKEALRAG
ncbi:MAG: DEAD/DEAH box helicase [Bacillota bacterium]|nr:DEAD/DEAH box helicase [Bacillota bacterium]